jgi:hypothetical protein
MYAPLAALLLLVPQAAAYAEAPTTVRRFAVAERLEGSLSLLQPTECSFFPLGERSTVDVEVQAHIAGLSTNIGQNVCVIVSVRVATDFAWWFVHPPMFDTDTLDTHLCSSNTNESANATEGTFRGTVTLKRGFNRITVRLDYSTSPHLPLLREHAIFVEVGKSKASVAKLQEVLTTVRASEAEEHSQRTREYRENALRYKDLALHPELQLREEGDRKKETRNEDSKQESCDSGTSSDALLSLEPLLDPALFAALRNNTPAALMALLGLGGGKTHGSSPNGFMEYDPSSGDGMSAPVPLIVSFPVLRLEVAEKLIQELQNAQRMSNADTLGEQRMSNADTLSEQRMSNADILGEQASDCMQWYRTTSR